MRYQEYKIPYPNPYKDNDLMIKEIINGTFTAALSSTLLSGQPITNRYQNFDNPANFVNNITQNATDIRTYTNNDNGMAYTMSQIKQMVYYPVYIKTQKGGFEYVYYPPFLYNNWKYTPDDGLVLATFSGDLSSYQGFDLHYMWGDKQGMFAVTTKTETDSNNNDHTYITSFHLITINGNDYTLLSDVELEATIETSLVFKGGAVIVLKFGDSDYKYYVFNIDKGTYKILSFNDSYNIFTLGDWGLWIKDSRVFDADGKSKWLVKKTRNEYSASYPGWDYPKRPASQPI